MKHRSTRDVVDDLAKGDRLIQVEEPINPHLEMAEIQRRVYSSGGPAILFTNVIGCRFPMVSNLFGSIDQARYLFRDTIESVRRLIELKIDPTALTRHPLRYGWSPLTAIRMLPRKVRRGPVMEGRIELSDLPRLKCWPEDGGAFVTLPQVLSADPLHPRNPMRVNLGMYRVQISGNDYDPKSEAGLHYQIHRGIGVHHRAAIDSGTSLNVSVTVGGTPAMTLAAVMPLPEGLTELTFAGALAGHRIPLVEDNNSLVYADADFAIVGEVDPSAPCKPEGPFGDHLGYYSLMHDFPVLRVKHVWHRRGAIWPFTVVGRPPQEDTTFGQLIHELTGPIIPSVIPGVKAVHAVDAAGVHPLLFAIGSERYMPQRRSNRPEELLTQAYAILGNGQLSLAKYLMITEDRSGELAIHNEQDFLLHVLRRIDPTRDLHFQTNTTIDTLDYSGTGFNRGSKVVFASADVPCRELAIRVPDGLSLPSDFRDPRVVIPGVLAVTAPRYDSPSSKSDLARFCREFVDPSNSGLPLITLVDDSDFVSRKLGNWLWVVFTRSDPARDIDGVGASIIDKHWGCDGAIVIDARIKPHHAPPLVEDEIVSASVDAMAARGGPLARYL
jgi:4-hydroxy-3-polyprenylbenzoate decarboxylase